MPRSDLADANNLNPLLEHLFLNGEIRFDGQGRLCHRFLDKRNGGLRLEPITENYLSELSIEGSYAKTLAGLENPKMKKNFQASFDKKVQELNAKAESIRNRNISNLSQESDINLGLSNEMLIAGVIREGNQGLLQYVQKVNPILLNSATQSSNPSVVRQALELVKEAIKNPKETVESIYKEVAPLINHIAEEQLKWFVISGMIVAAQEFIANNSVGTTGSSQLGNESALLSLEQARQISVASAVVGNVIFNYLTLPRGRSMNAQDITTTVQPDVNSTDASAVNESAVPLPETTTTQSPEPSTALPNGPTPIPNYAPGDHLPGNPTYNPTEVPTQNPRSKTHSASHPSLTRSSSITESTSQSQSQSLSATDEYECLITKPFTLGSTKRNFGQIFKFELPKELPFSIESVRDVAAGSYNGINPDSKQGKDFGNHKNNATKIKFSELKPEVQMGVAGVVKKSCDIDLFNGDGTLKIDFDIVSKGYKTEDKSLAHFSSVLMDVSMISGGLLVALGVAKVVKRGLGSSEPDAPYGNNLDLRHPGSSPRSESGGGFLSRVSQFFGRRGNNNSQV